MSSTTFIIIGITYYIIALIIIIVVLNIINKKENNNYQKKLINLERDKNLIISTGILSELNKVESLINNDKMRNIYEDFQKRFNSIKNDDIPSITDELDEIEELFNQKKYKELKEKIIKLEYKIYYIKTKSNTLLKEIKEITLSEDKNRDVITKLKTKYRSIITTYNNNKEEYNRINDPIELQFETVDKLFSAFERAVEEGDYTELSRIVKALEDLIGNLDLIIKEAPAIILMAEKLIPNKIEDILNKVDKMKKEGYNLDYLNIDYNFDETKKKIEDILTRLNVLNIVDSTFDLKTIITYLEDLYNEFDKEKLAKKQVEEYVRKILVKANKYEKINNDLAKKSNDFKYSYDLTDDDLKVISIIKQELKDIKADYNKVVEVYRNKSLAYSRILKEMEIVNNNLSKIGNKLDEALKDIGGLREDEVRAREQLIEIKEILRKAKNKINSYKMPSIPQNYYVELAEATNAIKEMVFELNKQPISIKVLNIRVDTARDLVLKLYNTANELVKTAYMAEMSIVYGNRYRAVNDYINNKLNNSEKLFYKGEFKKSLECSINAINTIEPDFYEVLKETLK